MSTLPTEVIELVLREITNTRAVLVFDVEIERPNPNRVPRNPRMRFRYVVDPPTTQVDHASWPGTYESEIAKTIRNLILAHEKIKEELCESERRLRGVIKVPAMNGYEEIRFNPKKHIICIRNVNYTNCRDGPWTDLNIEIEHLAFMDGTHPEFRLLRLAFPRIQHIYGVFVGSRRFNPAKPIDVVWPAREPHTLSPGFLCLANGRLVLLRRRLYCEGGASRVTIVIPGLPELPFYRLVLI